MTLPHIQLTSGTLVTGGALGVAWLPALDILLRISASAAGLVAACLTAAVAIRTLRKK